MSSGREPGDPVAEAARMLAAGGIVAYPTETVYGLAVDARNASALAALLEVKGRDAGRGISVLVADLDMALPLLEEPPPAGARALAQHFWPGPLTIVLPASTLVAEALRGPSGGIGLRCSSDACAAALVAAFGAPLTSTSANRSGREPARSAAEVRAEFAAECADGTLFVLDGGARRGSDVSTVVEFSKGNASVLRAGAVRTDSIASVIPLAEDRRG